MWHLAAFGSFSFRTCSGFNNAGWMFDSREMSLNRRGLYFIHSSREIDRVEPRIDNESCLDTQTLKEINGDENCICKSNEIYSNIK